MWTSAVFLLCKVLEEFVLPPIVNAVAVKQLLKHLAAC